MNLTTPDRNLLGAAMSQMLDDKEVADIVAGGQVSRFINFWKMATDDGEFRELLKLCVEKAPALRMVKD